MIFRRLVIAGMALSFVISGCSASSAPGAGSKTITVLAASSLKEVFTKLGKQYEAEHPGVTVVFSFGASSSLAQQVVAGSPADVLATASLATMETASKAGAVGPAKPFASNVLAIATPPNNPAGVTALADLSRPGVKVAVCQPAVPCGVAARQLFAKAGLAVRPVSEEADVKSVLSKVELGEVDAGIVYVTDVQAAGPKVVAVQIAAANNITSLYPIASVKSAGEPTTAADFVAFVLSSSGQLALGQAGFGPP